MKTRSRIRRLAELIPHLIVEMSHQMAAREERQREAEARERAARQRERLVVFETIIHALHVVFGDDATAATKTPATPATENLLS